MNGKVRRQSLTSVSDRVLRCYLLGSVPFEEAINFQRRLVFQVGGDRTDAALVLCEHPPIITVGRSGSRTHILCEPLELAARQWAVRWVNRGGGCILHLPGQLAVYPIIALDQTGQAVRDYVRRLHEVLIAVLADFDLEGIRRPDRAGVWVGERPIAAVGVAVRGWVTYYGAVLNINPDLELFRRVRVGRAADGVMTSLERERRGPLRPSLVRERLIEHFALQFGFSRTSLFHDHPALIQKAPCDAVPSRRRGV